MNPPIRLILRYPRPVTYYTLYGAYGPHPYRSPSRQNQFDPPMYIEGLPPATLNVWFVRVALAIADDLAIRGSGGIFSVYIHFHVVPTYNPLGASVNENFHIQGQLRSRTENFLYIYDQLQDRITQIQENSYTSSERSGNSYSTLLNIDPRTTLCREVEVMFRTWGFIHKSAAESEIAIDNLERMPPFLDIDYFIRPTDLAPGVAGQPQQVTAQQPPRRRRRADDYILQENILPEGTVRRRRPPQRYGSYDPISNNVLDKRFVWNPVVDDYCFGLCLAYGASYVFSASRDTRLDNCLKKGQLNLKSAKACSDLLGIHPMWLCRAQVTLEEIKETIEAINKAGKVYAILHEFIDENGTVCFRRITPEYPPTCKLPDLNLIIHKNHVIFMKNRDLAMKQSRLLGTVCCPMCTQWFHTMKKYLKHNCAILKPGACRMCGQIPKYPEEHAFTCSNISVLGHPCLLKFENSVCRFPRIMDEDDRKQIIYFADIECSQNTSSEAGENEHVPVAFCAYCPEFNVSFECGGDEIYTFFEHLQEKVIEYKNMRKLGKQRLLVMVYFHNLAGYDSNFLFKALCDYAKTNPENKVSLNKVIEGSSRLKASQMTLSMGTMTVKIKDSYSVAAAPLASLVENVKKACPKYPMAMFPSFYKYMSRFSQDQKEMLLRKQTFPYLAIREDFIADERPELLDEIYTDAKWFEGLDGKSVSTGQRLEALSILKQCGIRSFRDAMWVYLRSDVSQLADVFNAVSSSLHKSFNFHPEDFVGLPAATWANWGRSLDERGIYLSRITDTDMCAFFSRGLRGGISCAIKRYARCEPGEHILYLDANSLYPTAMKYGRYPICINMQKETNEEGQENIVHYDCFEELTEKEIADATADYAAWYRSVLAKGRDCMLMVDLDVPWSLRDYYDDYPLAPETMGISRGMMSPWSQDGNPKMVENRALCQTLLDKRNYVVHGANLDFYLAHGLVLRKVIRGYSYPTADIFGEYVQHNIDERAKATAEYASLMIKLYSNALYGKTMERKERHRACYHYPTIEDLDHRLMKHPNEQVSEETELGIFTEEILTECDMDRPLYLGAMITEFSKLHMYVFLYDILYPCFGRENVQVCYTDTDSFILKFRDPTCETPEEVEAKINAFDVSALAKNPTLHSYPWGKDPIIDTNNRKYLGGFKNECPGDPIIEYVGNRAKSYSYLTESGKNVKKAKGTPKGTVQTELDHKHYLKILHNPSEEVVVEFRKFVNKNHKILTQTCKRISLSAYDTKRYIEDDGLETHALGYYDS